MKRFKEGGSYVGDEKFNKHRRMGGSTGNSADNLVGESSESQKVSNKDMVHDDILNNRDNSIVPSSGTSNRNGTSIDHGAECVTMTTDGMEHSETESSISKDTIGRPPPPPPPQQQQVYTTSTTTPTYFSGKMDTAAAAAMDVTSSSKQAVEAGTPVSNSPSPRKRGVSPGKFGAFLGIASFETSPSREKDNSSAMEVCSSSPTKAAAASAVIPDSPSKFAAFLGMAPIAKMPPTAPTAPILPPAAAPSSSSSSSSSSATHSMMAGSRAAQEALDRSMVSILFIL